MKKLFLIPARGGSKRIPHKNIRDFCGKPLIQYSIETAREFADDKDICISTDDNEIIKIAKSQNLEIPFTRPQELAADEALTDDVIRHALSFYRNIGIIYDCVVLLQPTSPLRTKESIAEAVSLYTEEYDMVLGVKASDAAAVLMEENREGYLHAVFKSDTGRRQDARLLYEVNGAVYVINAKTIMLKNISDMKKIKKFVMSDIESLDIDEETDWIIGENMLHAAARQREK